MSLSSKLRDFRKTLKKKTKSARTFADEQLNAISKHMPMDAASLEKILSKGQMAAFGEGVLEITQGHTIRDQEKFDECISEMDAFVRGGLPGMECLNKVYPQIFKHFCVEDDSEDVFEALGLFLNPRKDNKLTLKNTKKDEEDPLSQ